MLALSLLATLVALVSNVEAAPASGAHSIEARASAPALPTYGKAGANGWAAYGCWQDTYPHLVPDYFERTNSMTQEYCASKCYNMGKPYMAVEYGSDCYCSSTLNWNNGAASIADSSCNMACSGNANQNCGGYYTLVLFGYKGTASSSSSSSSAAASSTSSSAAASSSSSAAASSSSSASASASKSSSAAASSSSSAAASSSSSAAASSSFSAAASSSAPSSAAKSSAVSSSASASSSASSSSAAVSSAAPASSSAAVSSSAASSAAPSASASSSASKAAASSAASSSSAAASSAASSAAASSSAVSSSSAAVSSAAPASSSAAVSSSAASSAAPSVAASSSASSSVAASSTSSSAAAASSSAVVVIDPLVIPAPWIAASNPCIAEATLNNGRALTGAALASDDMTYTKCLNFCSAGGFSIAAVEFGRECFCGNILTNGAALSKTSSQCNMNCGGSTLTKTAVCGGSNALNLFVVPSGIASLNSDLTSSVATLPTGWAATSPACISEASSGRALAADSFSADNMTISMCVSYCDVKGYGYAGLEYGRECYCANTLTNTNPSSQAYGCNMPCAGDKTAICGGPSSISLYRNPSLPKVNTPTLPTGWSAASSTCIQEVSGRALVGASTAGSDMTVPKCLNFCQAKGLQYAALEYGGECYCGNALVNGASLSLTSSQCNMACNGDSSTTCGGPNGLQLYVNSALAPSNSNGFSQGNCIQEVAGRALTGASITGSDMTVDKCTSYCSAQGFTIAGLEYGGECYCGNSLVNGASTTLLSGQCNMACTGGSGICGGPNAINLYTSA
ncbi:hypothetical protein IAU59_001339 [Kwoniella sp. CBS 9459]